jgi:hypothetical protein
LDAAVAQQQGAASRASGAAVRQRGLAAAWVLDAGRGLPREVARGSAAAAGAVSAAEAVPQQAAGAA